MCPASVGGTAKDRPRRKDNGEEKGIATLVFDYGFSGTARVKENLPVQTMKHVQRVMICAHAIPHKGLMDAYVTDELVLDIRNLSYNEVILQCDGESGQTNFQKEVKSSRKGYS